jgi:hypothetical protein
VMTISLAPHVMGKLEGSNAPDTRLFTIEKPTPQ